MIVTVLSVIIVICFLVFVHELGHYLGARLVGVKVIEFSIGFPPKLVSKTIGQTEYMISALPIGGYVRLLGQNIDDENPEEEGNYASKSIGRRLVIMIAGPLMNLLVAFLLMPLIFWSGYDAPAYLLKKPVIEGVVPGSEAEKLEILQNDIIWKINDKSVNSWKDVSSILQSNQSDIIPIELKRDSISISRSVSANLIRDLSLFGIEIKIDPIIGNIAKNSAAERAGLKNGDIILSIDDQKVETWGQISPLLQLNGGKTSIIHIKNKEGEKTVKVSPEWSETGEYWIIGVTSQSIRVSEPFFRSVSLGFKRVINLTRETYRFLFRLISGKEKSDSVGGPIMIAQMVGQAANTDFGSLLALVAFISLQFCIFNLLPIPALDGGHVLFLIFETIKGKSLSPKFRVTAQKVGFSLLMTLILLITIQDSIRVIFR